MKHLFKILSKKNMQIILILISAIFLFFIVKNPIILLKSNFINDLVKDLGFELKKVSVLGANIVLETDVINSIVFESCDNLFCIDLEKSKNKLESNNWIKSAKLKYSLPSQLIVKIEEEKPTFILKNSLNISLLNIDGKKIQDLKTIPNDFKKLIILSGEGVEDKVYNLLTIFSINQSIAEKIIEATLVSSRRWSLKHSSNIVIELPEVNPDKAFYKIVELEKKYGFLNDRIKKVDLRSSDRMIVQLKSERDFKSENDI